MHALAGMLVSPGEGEGDTVLLSKIKARRRFNGDGVEEGRDRHATPRKFRLVGSRPACWIITCHDLSSREIGYLWIPLTLSLRSVSKVKVRFRKNVETIGSESLLLSAKSCDRVSMNYAEER